MPSDRLRDREQAGRLLAAQLRDLAGRTDVTVLGLPRGGVVVAAAIARELRLPLDVLIVRKLGVPGQPELAMGAIADHGRVRLVNEQLQHALAISDEELDRVTAEEALELERREQMYRNGKPPLDLRDRTAIVVDDGIATGATLMAALAVVRGLGARQVVVATGVAPSELPESLRTLVDRVEFVLTPQRFEGVGDWYDDFRQTTDDEVCALLNDSMAP
ncbi:MAG: phosphoribosyltransferase [Bryobacterales bacterium]|nr:phosphoribosyltransferase [Bryobacterales bacterium]